MKDMLDSRIVNASRVKDMFYPDIYRSIFSTKGRGYITGYKGYIIIILFKFVCGFLEERCLVYAPPASSLQRGELLGSFICFDDAKSWIDKQTKE